MKTHTAVLTLLLLSTCAAGRLFAEDAIRFTDVSKAAGTLMQHRSKHPDGKIARADPNFVDVYAKGYYSNMLDVTFLDANGDGHLDIFMLSSEHNLWSRLWLGNGKGGLTEVKATNLSPGSPECFRTFAYDFQGLRAQDIILTSAEGGYSNWSRYSQRLRRVTPVPERMEDFSMFRSLMWTSGYTQLLSDVDGDGCVDVVTGNYMDRGSPAGRGWVACGIVTDGEIEHDRTEVPLPVGGHAVAADFDGDGLVDVLGRGFWTTPHLMRNLGRRRFADVTRESGLAEMPAGGPFAVADFNNDGTLDLFCLGKLYLGTGEGKFKDVTETSGLLPKGQRASVRRFGTATAADFNNDGFVDIFVCDGNTNHLYHNVGGGVFREVTAESGVEQGAMDESSNAAADFDADGRVDLVLITRDRGVGLFRNTSTNANGWIRAALRGPTGNPEGAGASVTVYEAGRLGDRKAILGYQQWIVATEFKIPRPLHFGLGTRGVCDVRVVFPGGKVVEKPGVTTGRTVVLGVDGSSEVR